eukprot:scaffold502_cov350-Pavlova_lutheri.AAC.7
MFKFYRLVRANVPSLGGEMLLMQHILARGQLVSGSTSDERRTRIFLTMNPYLPNLCTRCFVPPRNGSLHLGRLVLLIHYVTPDHSRHTFGSSDPWKIALGCAFGVILVRNGDNAHSHRSTIP